LGKQVKSIVQSVARNFSNDLSFVLPPELRAASGAKTHLDTSQISLLTEVDFKWLMAGQGWHVDATRFQTDAEYAKTLLGLALGSNCPALRDCATHILEASPIAQP
jgi:hypothetical protein